ncbi:MAG TPA: hypothetical protein VE548_15160 [Nitrososphaeraceae archaeon]|jgi:hypothetical protein|nr:hypothetical protein [Nitrososphaeraceae archaeon]
MSIPDAQKLIFACTAFGIENTIVAATSVRDSRTNIAIEFIVWKIREIERYKCTFPAISVTLCSFSISHTYLPSDLNYFYILLAYVTNANEYQP